MKTICGKENTFVVTLDDTFRKKRILNAYYMVEFFSEKGKFGQGTGTRIGKIHILCIKIQSVALIYEQTINNMQKNC